MNEDRRDNTDKIKRYHEYLIKTHHKSTNRAEFTTEKKNARNQNIIILIIFIILIF
jgi:hypothetical protein